MVNKFWNCLKKIYLFYIQAILFIAGFVLLNIACYRINVTAGLFVSGFTLILFGLIINSDQEKR
ncbi:DUF1056 family protein [Lactobacillus crispatus]|uniref:DUF1056 family protein n=1 Tax=Lactobacillus crispatus TaxID=47770 RepID=UPI000559177C|nr:DUF1056 domain-containing protein [Lactobacillus crispatus]